MQTTILIGLFICHFLADFTPLSTPQMLNAKRLGSPLFPIFCHAAVHAWLMGIWLPVVLYIDPSIPMSLWWKMVAFQLLTHFVIDVWKGKMNRWFPFLQNQASRGHWVLFGFDQLLHAVVIVLMSYFLVNN